MIKVFHLANTLDVGGAELMLLQLVRNLNTTKFKSIVASITGDGTLVSEFEEAGATVYETGHINRLNAPWQVARLARIIRRERPQVLQTWLYYSDLMGLVCGRITGVTNILWNIRCSDMRVKDRRESSRIITRVLARFSPRIDAIVVNSVAGRDFHQALGYRPKEWLMIPNGIDLSLFRPMSEARLRLRQDLNVQSNTRLVGLVGRFDPVKGHEVFLEAAAQMNASHSNIHYVLAGRGVDSSNGPLRDLIEKFGLTRRVHLLGQRRDIGPVTAALDVATCSSHSEGFPNVIGEAMACCVPCVATDVGDAARVIGDTGLIVPADNPRDFADACIKLIDMPVEGRRKLGQAARSRVERHFSLAAAVEKYESLYSRYDVSKPSEE